jgi:hypothetical protein
MLHLPQGGIPAAAVIVAKTSLAAPRIERPLPEPHPDLINTRNIYWELSLDTRRHRARVIRAARKARNGDGSVHRLYADALAMLKKRGAANKALRDKLAAVVSQDGEMLDVVNVEVGFNPDGTPFVATDGREIAKIYDRWIVEAGEDRSRAQYLRMQKIDKLEELARRVEAQLTVQKSNGLWLAKVEANAARYAAARLMLEAADARLSSASDAHTAASFVERWLRTELYTPDDHCSDFVIAMVMKKIAKALAPGKGPRRRPAALRSVSPRGS